MSKLPRLSGKKLIKLLKREGYVLVRVEGSHHHFRHPQKKRTITVPLHGNRDIAIGTLHTIVTEMMELSIDDFLRLLQP